MKKALPVRRPRRQFFKAWRKHFGLTQERAVERLDGWSQMKLSRIESGTTVWNANDLADLEQAYGVTAELLLNVDPEKEGDVVDLLQIMRKKDLAVVRAIIENLPSRTGTDD